MCLKGRGFNVATAVAQKKVFNERDPSATVSPLGTARKTADGFQS